MNIHKILVGIGIAFLVFIPIWIMFIVPELLKLDEDYEREFDIFYINNEKYGLGGEFKENTIAKTIVTEKTLDVIDNSQIIESHYLAETLNGDLIWEATNTFKIDRLTKKIIKVNGEESNGIFYFFPRKLEKKGYSIWPYGYINSYDVKYIGIEEINGLETYHYSFEDIVSDETEGYLWLDLVPETYYASTIASSDFFVEPVSGIIIDWQDRGTSYYVDKVSGEKIEDFYIWTDNFKDDTIANQVRLAQNEKQRILLIDWIVPIVLGLIGIALIFSSYIGRRMVEDE